MSSVVEVLTKARALVERGWTQRASARNERGEIVPTTSDAACTWCALGALSVCGLDGSWVPAAAALAVANFGTSDAHIPTWNDAPERTQAEVVAAFDRAIAAEVARV
jgi:hypothetical protein